MVACSAKLTVGVPHTARVSVGSPKEYPLCVQLGALDVLGVSLKMSAEPPTASVCVRVDMLTAPRDLQEESRCFAPEDDGLITLPLLAPEEGHTYLIFPSVEEGADVALTTEVVVDEEKPRLHSAVSTAGSAASPPRCAPPSADNRCASKEERAVAACYNDTEALHRFLPDECPADGCTADVMACLLAYKEELQWPQCIDQVESVSQCLRGVGELLFPMVIAAYLLLATASVVLLCTMLRCCCRCVCAAPRTSSQDEPVSEDEGTDADEEYIVTPLPSGVKQAAKEEEDDDENALPGYTEVVEGAAVLPREPLQTSWG